VGVIITTIFAITTPPLFSSTNAHLGKGMIINVRKLTGNKPMPTPKYLHLITILDDTNLGHYLVKNLMMEFPDYKSKYPFCISVAKFQKSECNHFLGHNRGSFSQKHALLW